MDTLSSSTTFVYKRLFPLVWFGGLALFLALVASPLLTRDDVLLFSSHRPGEPPPAFFIAVPLVMAVFGYAIMRFAIFDLADEVVDLGDALRVRRAGETVQLPLRDIANVDISSWFSPPRVTLLLRQPSVFGGEVAFIPAGGAPQWRRNAMVDALAKRVEAARKSVS